MAMTPNSVILPQALNTGAAAFTIADTTTKKNLLTAGTGGTIVRGIAAQSDDSANVDVVISITIGGTDYKVGTVRVAALAGSNGTSNSVDLLNATNLPFLKNDAAGNACLMLPPSAILKVNCLATMTTAKTLNLVAFGEDF
jgi:hypothetical protein